MNYILKHIFRLLTSNFVACVGVLIGLVLLFLIASAEVNTQNDFTIKIFPKQNNYKLVSLFENKITWDSELFTNQNKK